ncbi:hypothetical protein Vadar_029599 [Vaccinium darrowii]|uniref:Uncharacterized protein n=1 Tax=Vaccinium darrowii TaxID=229202 RepID=A0ACB7X5E8_9ERIC|nr:hypothetical protein Vadar_029599 [Vaccinium darrowii]
MKKRRDKNRQALLERPRPSSRLCVGVSVCGVKLHSILTAPSEFDHDEKGDALYAMELALSLEKLVNEKLLNLRSVEAIKKIADYVTQLRMLGMDMVGHVGNGHDTYRCSFK